MIQHMVFQAALKLMGMIADLTKEVHVFQSILNQFSNKSTDVSILFYS